MNDLNSPDSTATPHSKSAQDFGFSPWQRLKAKRISYLTLPLLIMATVTEFVILATGWKYQQVVCLPQGMAVTFFGIGPIGATILAVELLKLPLAIWTASRRGWQKGVMLMIGLPLICLLTFQLVKDMAVYEMGVALTPASQYLDKALAEETKSAQLEGELTAIEQKKGDRQHKLDELAAKEAKGKADLQDALQRNDDSRKDAVNLTDYQKNELSQVESRQSTIIQQFNADTEQINKALTDLRSRRETELSRANTWNAEEARIDNAYKAATSDYQNKEAQYQKDKDAYANANFFERPLMKKPVDPGVAPQRESDTILKPTALAEIDEQIKAKEAELLAVNNRRRDSVAQVGADAQQLRAEYDHRSSAKREDADHQRQELLNAQAAMATEWKTDREQIDQDLAMAVQKVDGIRAELDDSRKKTEADYEARVASIKNTQVYRIATTVEIVRGLIKGERPMSIKASAKERGDIMTDQISMVRIWVYPVLAFIVAFLPTLMVELGFSTVFEPEKQRPNYRFGFLGRHLHELYVRAGRQKILRAERMTKQAASEIALRDHALAAATAEGEKALVEKQAEFQATHDALSAAIVAREEQLRTKEQAHAAELKIKEDEWVAKLSSMADSLNRTVIEKDALRDLQKSEVERQVQMRQNAWSDRVTQLRQELDEQRAASETERMTLMQEHHQKLMEVSEESKTQVMQARRQAADAELAAVETSAKLTHELQGALQSRDEAAAQLQQQTETWSLRLSQSKEDAGREIEKAARQEKHRVERQQLEFGKILRQREEEYQHQLKHREQELSIAFDARVVEEHNKVDQEARRREVELARQYEIRAIETDARWKQETQQREEAAQIRLKQQEQQLQAQAEVRLAETQSHAEQELRRRLSELDRQFESQSRETTIHYKQESQQRELAFQTKLKQREQELAVRAEAREIEWQSKWGAEMRTREEEWERQAESRVRAAESQLGQELQQKEEQFQTKLRQRDQHWQSKLDTVRAELQGQSEEALRHRETAAISALRAHENLLRQEMEQKEEAAHARLKQREQELETQFTAQAEARHAVAQARWKKESEDKMTAALEPLKTLLARSEKERDEARQTSLEGIRHLQSLEKKLTETSLFLTPYRNGNEKQLVEVD
jgi:hypothetical protein